MTHMDTIDVDTYKGVVWQHFCGINFRNKHKKRENHENLAPWK